MVNPKAAILQLVNAIMRKITEYQDYATDYEAKPWNAFVESGAVELLEVLKEKQRNFETRWQNEFEAQLTGNDWETLSEEDEAFTETTPIQANSPYSASKASADRDRWAGTQGSRRASKARGG